MCVCVYISKGISEGDPLEMLVFNLTTVHLWGRVLAKFEEARAIAYADDGYMVLHLPHAEGDFGVTFNDITKDAAFYTTTSRFVSWLGAFELQVLWLPKDEHKDSSSWSSCVAPVSPPP